MNSPVQSAPSRPHLTPGAPAYTFHELNPIALPSHTASTACQADTHVVHGPLPLASQPPATPLEKRKPRIVFDSPASVTTMAADLRHLSRARPPPAPSFSSLSPVRATIQQLDYRVAELDRLQTDPASSSSNQPTTTELQFHQEIQQLAHQL